MANISGEQIVEGSNPLPDDKHLSTLALPELIMSSSTLKIDPNQKYPLNNPENILLCNNSKSARESTMAFKELQNGGKCRKFWWWEPEQEVLVAEFLESSSMHGLKYASQSNRNLIERLFWAAAFLSCVVGATIMIGQIWQRYYDNPVIVTFNPAEIDVDVIPFPAITICNINPFRRSRIQEFENVYKLSPDEEERNKALDALRLMNTLCSAQPSFLQSQNFARNRGKMTYPEARKSPSEDLEKNITQFLLENTQSCDALLRLCVWEQKRVDCGKIFKATITDYGKCCSFNMLPRDLMEKEGGMRKENRNRKSSWTKKELKEWSKWNYDVDGYILNPDLKYPRRQRRVGTLGGLTLLIDPDIENSFCPSTDSEGVKVLYHVPLDAPRVADLGLVVGVDREVFLEVNPDLTVADDGISSFSHETRKCYFGLEYKLEFYKPYTRSNCLEECWGDILLQNCSCVLYYSQRNQTAAICSTNPESSDYKCIQKNERRFLGRLRRICDHCLYSCNDLEYNAEVTYAQLQKPDMLWGGLENETVDWMNRSVSIVHIFMGAESTVPKLRQKLYQAVDLIANTGGLLGLSVGFSVLSAVEIVYFATMRFCCKRLHKSKRFGQPSKEVRGNVSSSK